MKLALRLSLVMVVILFTNSALAAPAPDCWTVDGHGTGFNRAGEEIADGQWLVSVDLKRASKADLVWLMSRVNRGNLDPAGYPVVFEPNFMVLHARLRESDGAREARRRGADLQVAEIAARNGVQAVECNGIAHPQ